MRRAANMESLLISGLFLVFTFPKTNDAILKLMGVLMCKNMCMMRTDCRSYQFDTGQLLCSLDPGHCNSSNICNVIDNSTQVNIRVNKAKDEQDTATVRHTRSCTQN